MKLIGLIEANILRLAFEILSSPLTKRSEQGTIIKMNIFCQ
ncbi:hypothetical protein NCDO763_0253 [Lactococcus cremoris]|uniref:Uncharacterized protein n=1 Tax=Lactococcus lactis subsp. cremoris TaxID=1359 RepID=A0A166IUN8_LACLC|nr:hypothetical protein AB996_2071 [Lactococcus cremoris]KZK09640.1 hypothetical protein V4_1130 [Lactococcus cremoris]KZK41354.1 hypothetical protein N41_0410 [Lactococcus cremoris]KZK43990.1 hypothetical protein B40_1405 [Lactococcus cremoris]KZK53470.1 hypothetical protein NCDO763_0253 [Lactococcus cremoris]